MSVTRRLIPLLLTLLLSGCGQAPVTSSPVRDEVVVALSTECEPAAGFDPAYGWGAGEHVHQPLLQSTLTVTMPDLTIGYDLASAFSSSEDGLTWSISLREDVVFSDGTSLTAEDVAFTYNTVKAASAVIDFTMLDYAEALDTYTVLFHMTRPFSIWPYTMAVVGIVPAHSYDSATYGQNPIGSGPYLLKQWDRGQQVILEANPSYYGTAPKLKKVTVLFMAEDAAFLAVKAGQVDLAYTAATYAGQDLPGYQLLSVDTVDNRGFNLPAVPPKEIDGVPIGNAVTCDTAVRQAISLGVNRQEMIDHVLGGYGTPAYSVCDKLPWYNRAAQVDYDLQAATALLDSAGWVVGTDGIREKDGVRAAFSLLYPTGDSVRQTLAAEFSNQMRRLGFETTPEGVGWDTAYDRALSQPMIWGWGAHTPMELYNIYHTAPGTESALYSPYANQVVDDTMDAALASATLEESYTLWQQAQWNGTTGVTPSGDAPWVWLVNVSHLFWVRDGLDAGTQKIQPHGHGWSIMDNVDTWHWKEGF